ncbi:MAG TPA: DUF86 domain-containing protein [Solirubrobacterales bacterium]|nr:DUF86 domain-containing protein [Solirubrobacterales bacterium]
MVDPDRTNIRIKRLSELIGRLEEIREQGEDTYLADPALQAMTERWLEVAIQICIDLGLQVLTEKFAPIPGKYADVFLTLGSEGLLPDDLAARLADAARQRNLLAHLYLEIDDKAVFASLSHLDDLRRFAAFVEEQLD